MWKNLEQLALEQLDASTASTPSPLPAQPTSNHTSRPKPESDPSHSQELVMDEDSDEEHDAWIRNMFAHADARSDPRLLLEGDDPLLLSLAEETAEVYILGRSHFEYSKMMDYLVEHLS